MAFRNSLLNQKNERGCCTAKNLVKRREGWQGGTNTLHVVDNSSTHQNRIEFITLVNLSPPPVSGIKK